MVFTHRYILIGFFVLSVTSLATPTATTSTTEHAVNHTTTPTNHDDEKNRNAENARSLDFDVSKYTSPEFHNKNNVYHLPTSPENERFVSDVEIEPKTETETEPFTDELTTPSSAFFDKRHREIADSIKQNLQDLESEQIQPPTVVANAHNNDSVTKVNVQTFNAKLGNDTESGLKAAYEVKFNNTKVIDENVTIKYEPILPLDNKIKIGDVQERITSFATTPRNLRRHNHNNTLPINITKRGNVRYTTPTPTQSLLDSQLQQSVQENNVVPILVPIPATSVASSSAVEATTRFYEMTDDELAGKAVATTTEGEETSPVFTTSSKEEFYEMTVGNVDATTMDAADAESTTPAMTETTESTTLNSDVGRTESSQQDAETTTSSQHINDTNTENQTTVEIPTTTVEQSSTTTTEEQDTTTITLTTEKLQSLQRLELKTTTEPLAENLTTTQETLPTTTLIIAKNATAMMPVAETTSVPPTSSENPPQNVTTTVPSETENAIVKEHSTIKSNTIRKYNSSKEMADELDDELEDDYAEIKKVNSINANNGTHVDESDLGGEQMATTTQKSPTISSTMTTTTTVRIVTRTTTMLNRDLPSDGGKDARRFFTTVRTAIYAPDEIESASMTTTTTTEEESALGNRDDDDDSASSGTVIAIIISSVGAVCLILLAVLLFVMRRRQKRFTYGQRCTPVSLDAYSMDNVSVYNSVRRKGALRGSKRSYGNPAFDDSTVSHPLDFQSLVKFARNADEIKSEFDDIPQVTARMSELPDGCDTKNRYANVIPLPETRVFLSAVPDDPNGDYINANFVTGSKGVRGYYIACQAPLQNTVNDFWRMIWEQQSKVVLMLTHLYENGVEKCIDYLPPSEVIDCHRLFGDYQITLKKREVKEKYIISSLQLKNMVTNSWREVTHLWYSGWPEKGVPSEENSLIAFLIEARSYMKPIQNTLDRKNIKENVMSNGSSSSDTSPVVVHCSPGTGRTGTVIACDIAIRDFELKRTVDIPKIVYRIRRDRASSVQTKDQYTFIYKVINMYATKLTGGVLDPI